MKLNKIILLCVFMAVSCLKEGDFGPEIILLAVYNQSATQMQITGSISSLEFVAVVCNTGDSDIILAGKSLLLTQEAVNVKFENYTTNYSDRKVGMNKCDTVDFLVPFDKLTNEEYSELISKNFILMFDYYTMPILEDTIEYVSSPNQFRYRFDSDERPKTILKMLQCKACCD